MKRILFLAILILGLIFSDAAAQTTDEVLVPGNPPLTQSMVHKSRDVFEFTFGGAFTDSEKDSFGARLISSWRAKDAETMKAVQDLVNFRDKINGLSRDQLLTVQKQLRETLVKDLQAQAGKDELALVLLNIYNRIQGLNAKQGGDLPAPKNIPQPVQAPDTGEVPREILGEWIESKNVGGGWVGGGSISLPNGEKAIMHFFADGTYKAHYHVQSSSSVTCTMIVDIHSNGTYSVGQNVLHLKEQRNHTISRDGCVARYNYEKENEPRKYAYPAYIEESEYGTRLVLTMNDGKHHFYFNKGEKFLGR